ncbi:MAG: succinate dehydrogenase/fumarate reductase iron-sulfur subunit [Thermoplasmata archaeon]|nr:MAG: succinate dehydrogenase/fumarate reductase iron-sulfur subunit [Thermoplasmata archaeon]
MMEKVQISVFRFDPTIHTKPYFDTFELETQEGMTVLDAMHKLKEEFDGTLTFRRSCRSNICGSCAARINGQAILMCKTQVKDIAVDNTMKVEPLSNVRVVKDLVVDMDIFWEKIKSVQPWLSTGYPDTLPEKEFRMDASVVKEIDKTTDCIMCGICYSFCESIHNNQKYFGPHVMAKTYRFVADTRDLLGPERAHRLIQSTGTALWLCVDCHNCEEFCPQKVKVLESGYQLRRAAYDLGICHPGLIGAKKDLAGRGKLLEVSEFEGTMRNKYKIPQLLPSSESAVKIIELCDKIKNEETAAKAGSADEKRGV